MSRAQSGDYNEIQSCFITSSTDDIIKERSRISQIRLREILRNYNPNVQIPDTRYQMIPIHNRHPIIHYENPILRRRYPMVPIRPDPADVNVEQNNALPKVIGSTRTAVISVGIIFLCSLLALLYVYRNFPNLEPEERQYMKLPWDINDAKNLGRVLDRYKDKYFIEVMSGIFVTYIFLQTFAIPGSLFLSILSGFLFPFVIALTLVCTCSALGASLCYLLSQLLGRRIVHLYFPERAQNWAVRVNKHRDNLFNYMLFLRMTPFLPNWFINLVAPVIGVPLVPFATGTFLGVAPPSFVAIQAGQTLHNMTSTNDAFSWTSIILLFTFAVFSLVPVIYKEKLKRKFE